MFLNRKLTIILLFDYYCFKRLENNKSNINMIYLYIFCFDIAFRLCCKQHPSKQQELLTLFDALA